MDNKTDSYPHKSGLFPWKNVLLTSTIGIALGLLGCFILYAIVFWNGTRMPKYLEIGPSEIPIYANSQNVSRDGPVTEDAAEIYSWRFSSSDAPDMVWQFYVDKMSQRWGFYDVSSSQSPQRELIVRSCPFYYLEMSSTPVDQTTYDYVIQLTKELCR